MMKQVIHLDLINVTVINIEADDIKTTIALPGHPLHITTGNRDMAYVIIDRRMNFFSDEYIGGIKLSENTFVDSLYFVGDVCSSVRYLACSRAGFLYGACNVSEFCDYFRPLSPFIVNTESGEVVSHNTFSSVLLKLSHDQKRFYAIGDLLGFFVFDAENRRLVKAIFFENSLATIALSPAGQKAYIVDFISEKISILDLSRYAIEDSIVVSSQVYDMLVTDDDQFIYASHPSANKVSVIDIKAKQVIKEVVVGSRPEAMALFSRSY
jgi:YVTN family beta-propeller protein